MKMGPRGGRSRVVTHAADWPISTMMLSCLTGLADFPDLPMQVDGDLVQ